VTKQLSGERYATAFLTPCTTLEQCLYHAHAEKISDEVKKNVE